MSNSLDISKCKSYNVKCKELLTFLKGDVSMSTITTTRSTAIPMDRKHIGMLFFAAAYVFLILIFHRLFRLSGAYDARISLWIKLISYCVLGTAGIFLFRDLYLDGFMQWKEHPVRNLLWIIGTMAADMILQSVAAIPCASLYPDYVSVNENNIGSVVQYAPAVLIIAALGVLGPVTEETVFRFLMVERAKNRVPAAVCVAVSSLCFMFIHVHALTLPDILYNLPMLVSGIIFAVCMIKSKNPTIPLLLHIMNNLPAFLALS